MFTPRALSATVSCCLLLPAPLFAQELVELSTTQNAYNEQGVALAAEKKFEQAVAKFRASLAIGEANIIWLNLGRTYQRMGKCTEAKDAYDRVPAASAVAAPSRDEVLVVVEKYRAELPEVCPIPATDPAHEDAALPDATDETPSDRPRDVEPRPSTRRGDVDAEGGSTPQRRGPRWSVMGTALTGTGILAIGGAFAVNELLLVRDIEDLETATTASQANYDAALQSAKGSQRLARVLLFSGMALTATGVTFLVIGLGSNAEVAVTPAMNGAHTSLRVRW